MAKLDTYAIDSFVGQQIRRLGKEFYGTVEDVQSTQVPDDASHIQTAGYYVVGDGGGALYKRASVAPSHGVYITSADGALWELAEPICNVRQCGAKMDDIQDDYQAYLKAYNYTPAGGTIIVPPGIIRFVGPLTGNKYVEWHCIAATQAGGFVADLPGLVTSQLTTRRTIRKTQTTNTDFAMIDMVRDTTHTGGTPGGVNSMIKLTCDVNDPDTIAYEWALQVVINNYAISVGDAQNVGIYSQARAKDTDCSGTWAMVADVIDEGNGGFGGNPNGARIALEVNNKGDDTDDNNKRFGIEITMSRADPTGPMGYGYAGIRVGPGTGPSGTVNGEGYWKNGLLLIGGMDQGVHFDGTGIDKGIRVGGVVTDVIYIDSDNTPTSVINHPTGKQLTNIITGAGTVSVGMNFHGMTFSGPVMRLAREQKISFEPTDAFQMFCKTAGSTITLAAAGTDRVSFDMGSPGAVNIAGTKVIGARDTGWTAMTGTTDKATSYDTGTVTLAQLAGRVMALQAALTTHGLIGA